MPLVTVGISHQTAPLEIREQLVFAAPDYAATVRELCTLTEVDEAVLLSTCNRTEIYAVTRDGSSRELKTWLADRCRPRQDPNADCFYELRERAAVAHLFRVACGLDSMVIGEPQIVSQLKEAWQEAREGKGAGKLTDRLFQHALAVSKDVRTSTGINQHPVSVAYIATVLARQIFGDMSRMRVLLVGAGEMIELCAQHFRQLGVGGMLIANRSIENAHRLAQQHNAEAMHLHELPERMAEADILISSTASPVALITRELARSASARRRHRPLFMVDLAVPRNIESSVGELPDVYLYSIDDLQNVADESLARRRDAADAAQHRIEAAVDAYLRWQHGARAAVGLQRIRERAEADGQKLAERAIRQLQAGADPETVLPAFGQALLNKLLHRPTTRLREAAEAQNWEVLLAADLLFAEPETESGLPDENSGAAATDSESALPPGKLKP